MRIMVDIGHPSHVHYFRNFIIEMKARGHVFLVTARNKEITHDLLNYYKLDYIDRGKGKSGVWGKFIYMIQADFKLLSIAKKFRPDILLSMGNAVYSSHISRILHKPHIALDDTDIATLGHLMYVPYTDCIISPKGFKKNFGKKHIIIDTKFDLFYLTKEHFKPNSNVKNELGLDERKKTIFFRFTSMNANHDWGYKKLSYDNKLFLINSLKNKYNVLLSSESKLPSELERYRIRLEPHLIYDVLYQCDLFIGESGSMSTEALHLGVPSINLTESAVKVGVFKEFVENELLFIIPNAKLAYQKAIEILEWKDKVNFHAAFKSIISKKIDPTSLLVWFVETYPESKLIMQNNNNFQYSFKLS